MFESWEALSLGEWTTLPMWATYTPTPWVRISRLSICAELPAVFNKKYDIFVSWIILYIPLILIYKVILDHLFIPGKIKLRLNKNKKFVWILIQDWIRKRDYYERCYYSNKVQSKFIIRCKPYHLESDFIYRDGGCIELWKR